MKYLLIAMMVVSTTAQAKSFSLSDYASQTGKLPAKVVKSDNSFTDKVKSTETAIIKREAKGASLQVRVGEVGTLSGRRRGQAYRSESGKWVGSIQNRWSDCRGWRGTLHRVERRRQWIGKPDYSRSIRKFRGIINGCQSCGKYWFTIKGV